MQVTEVIFSIARIVVFYPIISTIIKMHSLECPSVALLLMSFLLCSVFKVQIQSLHFRVPSKLNNVKTQDLRLTLGSSQEWLPACLLRKEVIQPLVLERLPCYDFTPITKPTFGRVLHKG